MKKLLIIIPITIVVLLSTCKKEDEFIDEDPQNTEWLLKKFTKEAEGGDLTEWEYEYYTDGKPKKTARYDEGILLLTMEYNYSNDIIWRIDKQYNSGEVMATDSTKYTRLNDESLKIEGWNNSQASIHSYIYNFSESSCGPERYDSYTNDIIVNQTFYEYLDDSCSVEMTFYDNNFYSGKLVIIKDNGNLTSEIPFDSMIHRISGGNWVQGTHFDSNDSVYESRSRVYEFNNSNYPTSFVETSSFGTIANGTYEYY